jgi:predicted RNase H-like HicB family nuclease
MKNAFTAVLKKDEGWWIGWIEEVPGVNCQAKTRSALIRSLRLTLKEALAMNREEALHRQRHAVHGNARRGFDIV